MKFPKYYKIKKNTLIIKFINKIHEILNLNFKILLLFYSFIKLLIFHLND